MVNYPFIEEGISEKESIRTFPDNLDQEDLLWHWDEEDRIIEPLEETNWLFQFDNHLPENINKEIYIKKGEWHRLIKGDGDLKLKIQKINQA
jgi:hypothetical protein